MPKPTKYPNVTPHAKRVGNHANGSPRFTTRIDLTGHVCDGLVGVVLRVTRKGNRIVLTPEVAGDPLGD